MTVGHLAQSRTDIMTVIQQIVTDFPDYALVVSAEGREVVDEGTQANPYLQVQIRRIGADQAELGARPLVEQRGQIYLVVKDKAGNGTSRAERLRDFIEPYFDMKDIGIVRTHAVEATSLPDEKGWQRFPLIVNFWYHRQSI